MVDGAGDDGLGRGGSDRLPLWTPEELCWLVAPLPIRSLDVDAAGKKLLVHAIIVGCSVRNTYCCERRMQCRGHDQPDSAGPVTECSEKTLCLG